MKDEHNQKAQFLHAENGGTYSIHWAT